MGKSNLMIRMIDIVFILLFGFIAVSQISSAEAIEPPKSTEAEEGAPPGTVILIIGVRADGTFTIDREQRNFRSVRRLEAYLAAARDEASAQGKQLGVRIRANWDAPVDLALKVARICRDLGIPKGLDVIRVKEK